jgi:type II secretory pathway pseudopilin PulG
MIEQIAYRRRHHAMPSGGSRGLSGKGKPRFRGGFTLIETTVASIIVALAVLAIVAAQQAFHRQNDWAGKEATGLSLANEMRELTMNLPQHDPITGPAAFGPEVNERDPDPLIMIQFLDDLDDFAGLNGGGITFVNPVNANRQPIPNLTGWTQRIWVENVAPSNIAGPAVTPNTTDLLRITVTASYTDPGGSDTTEIARLTWIASGD